MSYLKIVLLLTTLCIGIESCKDKWQHTRGYSDKARAVYLAGREATGYCKPQPYVPGGGEIIIESFDAPQAELQHNGIANMAKWVGFSASVTSDLSGIAALSAQAAKSCAKLAAHLGIWGTVFGFISGQNTPTPDDIIDAVNEALGEMTKLVNDQFTNMEGYVKQEVMAEAKDRWEDKYSEYYNHFTRCFQYDPQGEDKVIGCMEDVEITSGSSYTVFMDYVSYMDDENWTPSVDDIKHMEVQFNVYNNYVHLRMMILLTLYGEYSNKTDDASRSMAKTYLKYLKDESAKYKRYTQFAYDKIVAAYETWSWQKWGGSIICDNVHNICESINTQATIDCRSRFDEVSLLSSQTCDYQVKVRCDGDATGDAVMIFDIDPLTKQTFAHSIYDWQIKPKYLAYHDDILNQVKDFWKPSVFKSQETLQQIHDGAEEKINNEYANVYAYQRGEHRTQAAHRFAAERKMELRRQQMAKEEL